MASRVTGILKARQLRLAGFLCRGEFSGGSRSAFILEDLDNGKVYPLATTTEMKEWIPFRRFFFNPLALAEGEKIIRKGLDMKADLVVVDEVGPWELEGGGWSSVLDLLAGETGVTQLWIAREGMVDEICRRWNIPGEHIFRMDDQPENILLEVLYKQIKNNQTGS